MIKSFDYNSPQVSEPVSGGLIKPYAYPEQKNYAVAGVEHGPGVVADLTKKADEAQVIADQGVTLKDIGEGFMALPGPFDVKGIVSGAIEGAKQVIQASPEKSLGNLGTPALDRGAKVLGDTISDAGNRIANAISTAQDTHASLLEKGVAGGEALLGVLNALFTPITVPLATVEGIPGVGQLAEGVSALFGAIGGGASSAVDSTINRLPVSNKTKDTIRPLSEEIAALAAQIAIGGKVAKGIDTTQGLFKIADTATKITDAIKADEFVKPIIEPPKTEVKPFDYSKVEKPTEIPVETRPISVKTAPETTKPIETTPIPSDVISVNDKQFQLSGKALEDYTNAKNTYEGTVKNLQKMAEGTGSQVEYAQKQLKAEGMKFSALKREITGSLTGTEISNKVAFENSNYKGKNVLIDVSGKRVTGTVDSAPAFGRFKVKTEDGVVVSKMAQEIIDPRTPKEIRSEILKRSDVKEYVPQFGEQRQVQPIETQITTPNSQAPKTQKTQTIGAPKPIETTGNEFTSRVFERLQKENPQLTGEATAEHIKLKEDAQKAVDLIAKDKQEAFDIAMGKKTSTEVTSTAVNIAMAEKALQDGDISLYSRLVRNRALEQTRRGQEIVAERGSMTDNSTSKYVKELIASRLDVLGKKYLSGLKDKLPGKRTSDKGRAMEKIDVEVKKVEDMIKMKKMDTKLAIELLERLGCI